MTGQVTTSDEAARLLVEADSFLRLGLFEKAIEHLSNALLRDPSLRPLREPLVKLYVSQRLYKSAIAELWTLLSPCDDPKEEIRLLRYIMRLGDRDPAATQRLDALMTQRGLSKSTDDASASQVSVSGVVEELRAYLGKHRPLTDLERTQDIHEDDTLRLKELQHRSQAVTRPNIAAIEAVAEDIALSSGNLKQELRELDNLLDQRQYSEAKRKIQQLLTQYPHSRRLRARVKQLSEAQGGRADEFSPVAVSQEDALSPDFHAAMTLPPWANTPPAPDISTRPTQPPTIEPVGASTIEVAVEDIREEHALQRAAPRRPPPPPPSSLNIQGGGSSAERALRSGALLRSTGQHEEAIALFEKAHDDPACGAMALLLTGLSYRDLNRPQDAITAFMRGINRFEISDADLSRLFYELGTTYERLGNAEEAILNFRLSLGSAGSFLDAEEHIAVLQAARTAR